MSKKLNDAGSNLENNPSSPEYGDLERGPPLSPLCSSARERESQSTNCK